MESKRFWGIVIIIILIAAFCTAVYATAFGLGNGNQNQQAKNEITTNYTLTDAQMAGINYVNFNFEGNTTGLDVEFKNSSNSLYDINVRRENNSKEPTVTYTKQGDVLNVNMALDSGSAKVALGNRCTYNGTLNSKMGGYSIFLTNSSKVDNLNATIKYLGGGTLLLGDTSFKNIALNVNTGGFMIQGVNPDMTTNGSISTNVQLGGVTITLKPQDNIGLKITGITDLGGSNFEPNEFDVLQNSTNILDIQTKGYNDKAIKLQINNTIGMGGINVNRFMMPFSMRNQ